MPGPTPQSSCGQDRRRIPGASPASAPAARSTAALPDGVRLVLNLPPGQAISGTLTRDWVRPTAGGTRP